MPRPQSVGGHERATAAGRTAWLIDDFEDLAIE
jgi:hypothetical protein